MSQIHDVDMNCEDTKYNERACATVFFSMCVLLPYSELAENWSAAEEVPPPPTSSPAPVPVVQQAPPPPTSSPAQVPIVEEAPPPPTSSPAQVPMVEEKPCPERNALEYSLTVE